MKPNSFTFANEDNELINRCLVPLVFQSDTYDHSESSERHVLQSLRRSRVKPPGPNADNLRL